MLTFDTFLGQSGDKVTVNDKTTTSDVSIESELQKIEEKAAAMQEDLSSGELAQQEMDNETRYFAECILGMHENTVNTPEDSMKTIALVHSEIRSANGKGEKTKV